MTAREFLQKGDHKSYLELLDPFDFEEEDIDMIFRCEDYEVLENIILKIALPPNIVQVLIKFYMITEKESPVLVKAEEEFGFCNKNELLQFAFDKQSVCAITWCIFNITPDIETEAIFGRGIDKLDTSDALVIIDTFDEMNEVDNEKHPSMRWWRAINNYSHNYDDLLENRCPFTNDSLEEISLSLSNSNSSDESEDESDEIDEEERKIIREVKV